MEETTTPQRKNKSYKEVLDYKFTDRRRIKATETIQEQAIIERDRAQAEIVHKEAKYGLEVGEPLAKDVAIAKIITFCEDILGREIETPLKASDKVAAARLLADITGLTGDNKSTTINVGVMDLRQATTEELSKELARLESQQSNIIDAELAPLPDDTNGEFEV